MKFFPHIFSCQELVAGWWDNFLIQRFYDNNYYVVLREGFGEKYFFIISHDYIKIISYVKLIIHLQLHHIYEEKTA